nr:hypothetical protein [Moraxella catarrhalis]
MPRPRTQNLANLSFVSIAIFTVSVAAIFIPSTAFAAFELGGTPTNLALLIFFYLFIFSRVIFMLYF